MNPPSRTDHAFANPLFLAAIGCFALCQAARVCFALANFDVPPLLMPLVALLLVRRVRAARRTIAVYDAGLREEETAGEAPTPDAGRPAS